MCDAGFENKNSHWHDADGEAKSLYSGDVARKQKHPHKGVLLLGCDSRYFQQVNDLVLVLPSG